MKIAVLHALLFAYAAMALAPEHERAELSPRALGLANIVLATPTKAVFNTKRPGPTGTFKAPANPKVLPITALIEYLGAASVNADSQLGLLAASLKLGSPIISIAPIVTPLTNAIGGVTNKLGLRERGEQELDVKEKRELEKRNLFGALISLFTQAFPQPAKTTAPVATSTSKAVSTTSSSSSTTTTKSSSTTTSSTTTKPSTTTSTTSKTSTTSSTTTTTSSSSSVAPSTSSSSSVSVVSSMTPGPSTVAMTTTSSVVSVANSTVTTTTAAPSATTSSISCLDSTVDDTVITSLFYYGGTNTTVYLCPGATIATTNAVFFWGTYQTLTTLGQPTDSTRATLVSTASNQTCVIFGAFQGNDYATVSNIQINGNRPAMGIYSGDSDPLALIEMGGNNYGQTVTNSWSYEPRGWSALHMIEGSDLYCSGSVVTNNKLGPAGHGPSAGQSQFNKRMIKRSRSASKRDNDPGTYPAGQWADGISMACRNSIVTGNTIIDATDGAIVVFGAPGTLVQGNTIIAETRNALGAINGVDFNPHNGLYTGTVVTGNTIDARNAMIKVGIALGPLSWGVYQNPDSDYYNINGQWTNNVFTTTGTTGYFNYGITISGHKSPTVLGNDFVNANFGGDVDSGSCLINLPEFGPMYSCNDTVSNPTLQSDMVQHSIFELTICAKPGPITIPAYSSSA